MRSSSSPMSVVVTRTQAPDPGAVNCACLHDDDLPRHPLHGRLQQLVSIHITAPTDRLLRLLPPQTTLPAALVIFSRPRACWRTGRGRHTRRRRRRTGRLVGGGGSGRRRPSIRFRRDMLSAPLLSESCLHACKCLYCVTHCMYSVQCFDRTRSSS